MDMNLLRLFVLAPKPEWCTTLDFAVMVYLVTVADKNWIASPTQAEIAEGVSCGSVNLTGLRQSIERLHEHGWIVWNRKAIAQRHSYQIVLKELPGGK